MAAYREPAIKTSFPAFKKIVNSRRSVRKFTDEKIPQNVIDDCLDMALAAPNSSNLQPWEFYVIQDETLLKKFVPVCLGQQAARAPVLVAIVERQANWRDVAKRILREWPGGQPPKIAKDYYSKLAQVMYTQGPMDVLGRAKKVGLTAAGMMKPMIRGPVSSADMDVWAAKSCALAAGHLMLAFRAAGYDSCPMEGFDAVRARKLLKLPGDATINMIVSAGVRAEDGVFSPRYRVPREEVIRYL